MVFVVQIFQLMLEALDVPFLAFAEGSLGCSVLCAPSL